MKPSWLIVAEKYAGTAEVPGPASNPKILGMAARFGGWVKSFFKDDDIPWCALFVGSCLIEDGLKSTNSMAARSYETYGQPLDGPALGAIVVFSRKGGGHVGFYLGQKIDGTLRVFGGNQDNSVKASWIAKDRLTAIRWPSERPLPTTGPIILAGDGQPVSTNEG